MKLLFIHQNFPGQFLHLARHLQAEGGHEIIGLGETDNIKNRGVIRGISTIGYPAPAKAGAATHHYLRSTEAAVRRGQAVARSLLELKGKGFRPDAISVHPGWGEALFVRDVFPDVPILMFCEYYFRAGEADLAFDPEFPSTPDWNFSVRLRNTAQVMSLITANVRLSPTEWQASRYPDFLRKDMRIIHEGVDTDFMSPDPGDTLRIQPLAVPGESRVADVPPLSGDEAASPLGAPITLGRKDKVITYIARNMEPYRGFHVFARALPQIQRLHPDAHILLVGHDGTSYSPALPAGETYKTRYLAEVGAQLDMSRVHFLGRVPYKILRSLYRISSVHVYLTYPFVLSWSMLEAMSCGALLVASDTEPVREAVRDGQHGLLVDFFDRQALVERIDEALREPERFTALRANARNRILERYELRSCLDGQVALLRELAAGHCPAPG